MNTFGKECECPGLLLARPAIVAHQERQAVQVGAPAGSALQLLLRLDTISLSLRAGRLFEPPTYHPGQTKGH